MFLNSGDVCIMSGPTRTAVHSVPRVICNPVLIPLYDDSFQSFQDNGIFTQEEKEFLNHKSSLLYNYMKKFRINLSIRQVKP